MEGWLIGIDRERYAESWAAASDYFRKELTEGQWVTALKQVRKPLGKCLHRKIASAQPTEVLTDVQTVTVTFHTAFEEVPEAVETVSFNQEANGEWRASGYFIRPR